MRNLNGNRLKIKEKCLQKKRRGEGVLRNLNVNNNNSSNFGSNKLRGSPHQKKSNNIQLKK